jgi:DNA-binding transcriptional ArsR family regulator
MDPTRREILQHLRAGPLSSGDIATKFPIAWATVSRHLAVLKDADLIVGERNGTSIKYELNTTVVQELAEHLMTWTRTGDGNA